MGSRAWLVLLAVSACRDSRAGQALDLAALDPEVAEVVRAASARVEAEPRALAAALELAQVLDANELDAPAESAWLRVTELAPSEPRGWYHLARIRERRGDVEHALTALARALELAPDYAPAHARLGRLQLDAGSLEASESASRRAFELDPSAPAPCLALARLELLRTHPEAAIAVLEPLRARLPREPYVNGLLARAWAMRGEEARAAEFLAAEEQAGPSSVRDPWQAEVQRRAVGLKARLERAKARLASGDPAAAWKELEPLAGRADELAVLDAQCQVLAALGQHEEVLARIEHAAPELRTSSLLAVKHALAVRALGDELRALAEIEAEVRRNPAHPVGHALRGELLFDLERYSEAIAALEEARAHEDRSLATALLLGRARGANGDLAGGLAELERAAREYPHAPKPWAYRSELLALDGRVDEARASLGEATQRGLEPELVARVSARLAELDGDGVRR